jgi:hypothetical protein
MADFVRILRDHDREGPDGEGAEAGEVRRENEAAQSRIRPDNTGENAATGLQAARAESEQDESAQDDSVEGEAAQDARLQVVPGLDEKPQVDPGLDEQRPGEARGDKAWQGARED